MYRDINSGFLCEVQFFRDRNLRRGILYNYYYYSKVSILSKKLLLQILRKIFDVAFETKRTIRNEYPNFFFLPFHVFEKPGLAINRDLIDRGPRPVTLPAANIPKTNV